MSIFGDLERVLADLYPYRVPLTLGGLAVAAAIATLIVRRGWHRPTLSWVDRNRLPSVVMAVVFLAVTLPTGYYLLSPLWERTTLVEASPLDSATVANLIDEASATPGAGAPASSGDATPTSPDTAPAAAGDGPRLLTQGAFGGADSFHFAEGRALIVETEPGTFVLRFEDFSIRNGPDLFVYLSSDPDAPSEDGIRLGGLKATDGAFNYEIPPGTDVENLRYAMVWCDRFSVLFATAPLEG
jgi:hypothetical protein